MGKHSENKKQGKKKDEASKKAAGKKSKKAGKKGTKESSKKAGGKTTARPPAHCTCCGKRCPLSKPRCGKGRKLAEKLLP